MTCKDYPFDYWKHIVVKNIIGTDYRYFTEYSKVFQGIDIDRCGECMVEGFISLSLPFRFDDMNEHELNCTLLSMGLKKIDYTELELMPELVATDSEFLCPHCSEDVIQLEEDMYDE